MKFTINFGDAKRHLKIEDDNEIERILGCIDEAQHLLMNYVKVFDHISVTQRLDADGEPYSEYTMPEPIKKAVLLMAEYAYDGNEPARDRAIKLVESYRQWVF